MANNTIQCDKCHAMVPVVRYVSNPGELAAEGRALGSDEPAKPYYVVECPNCGKRIISVT